MKADQQLTDKALIFQLCQLETALELRVGDIPASQIIRAATRRIELLLRQLAASCDEARSDPEYGGCPLEQRSGDVMEIAFIGGKHGVVGEHEPECGCPVCDDSNRGNR